MNDCNWDRGGHCIWLEHKPWHFPSFTTVGVYSIFISSSLDISWIMESLELDVTTILKIDHKTLMLARTKFPSTGISPNKGTWTMGVFTGVGSLMWVRLAMGGSMRFWRESTGSICSNSCCTCQHCCSLCSCSIILSSFSCSCILLLENSPGEDDRRSIVVAVGRYFCISAHHASTELQSLVQWKM